MSTEYGTSSYVSGVMLKSRSIHPVTGLIHQPLFLVDIPPFRSLVSSVVVGTVYVCVHLTPSPNAGYVVEDMAVPYQSVLATPFDWVDRFVTRLRDESKTSREG